MPFVIEYREAPDQLKRTGPVIPGSWQHPNAGSLNSRVEGLFLIDTGAGGVLIDGELAETLNAPKLKTHSTWGIGGEHTLQEYSLMLLLPGKGDNNSNVLFRFPVDCSGAVGLRRRHEAFGKPVIGVLGRVFLQFARLHIDGLNGYIRLDIDETIRNPKA